MTARQTAQRGARAAAAAKTSASTSPTTKTPRIGAQKRSAAPRRKFHNVKVEINGITFDSKAEGERYVALRLGVLRGEILELEAHPKFPLVVHEQSCGYYEADFRYLVAATGERIVEDVKSPVTRKLPVYRLKIALVWALYGIRVQEVMA